MIEVTAEIIRVQVSPVVNQPMVYKAIITQQGASEPTIGFFDGATSDGNVLVNTLVDAGGVAVVPQFSAYGAVGVFNLALPNLPVWDAGKCEVTLSTETLTGELFSDPTREFAFYTQSGTADVGIYSNSGGVQANGLIYNQILTITIYTS